MIYAKTCPKCGTNFTHDTMATPDMVYCGSTCRISAQYDRRVEKARLPRVCPRCGVPKAGEEFSSGTHAYCRPCAAAYARERRASGDATEQAKRRRSDTLKRYGLTAAQFEAMLIAQGGRCAICQAEEPGGNGIWHVDHDHSCCSTKKTGCGKCIRGLLCGRCNIGLGNFGDRPETLELAAAYLRTFLSKVTELRS